MPGAALACVAALPARYVATGVLLGSLYLPSLGHRRAPRRLRALATGRGPGRPASGLADDRSAWPARSPGAAGPSSAPSVGYLRLLRAEAGHLVAALALAGLAAGIVAAVAYAIVLALPAPDLGPGGGRQLLPLRHPADRPADPGRPRRAGRTRASAAKRAGVDRRHGRPRNRRAVRGTGPRDRPRSTRRWRSRCARGLRSRTRGGPVRGDGSALVRLTGSAGRGL